MALNAGQLDERFFYDGDDLGANISEDKERTVFKVWSPEATGVYLNLYMEGEGNNKIETLPMEKLDKGVWYVEVFRSCDGLYYTYSYEFNHESKREEAIDIYAKGCGVNGKRGAVIDFDTTDPKDWDEVVQPICENPCDAVLYECHIRDFSIDESSGVPIQFRGKFKGFYQRDTKCGETATCLEHLKELGITHVHLLPVADYATVDESKPEKEQYNWGYDPLNYNCLEGSYSTDPYDAKCRIREFKKLVRALHKNGIGVVMDVVYNHTYHTENSAFEIAVPKYYHRINSEGKFTNGSGCGNETASDHLMMRKYIIDSVKFWAKEYKIDGFRFDLMAIHDIETVNLIRDELNKINPQILMYGEGWTGGEAGISADRLAYKWNSYQFGRVGLFNDNIRDAIKGGTFDAYEQGYVSGNRNKGAALRRGIVGSVPHSQLGDNAKECCWAYEPSQAINYCEAHDNNTVWDKLKISAGRNHSRKALIEMDKLSAAIVILSQGVPFIQLGQDFLRTKPRILDEGEEPNEVNIFNHNSYNAPDYTNAVKWQRKTEFREVFDYYRELIALRKSSGLFRLSDKAAVENCLKFMDMGDCDFICYKLENLWEEFIVMLNPYNDWRSFDLPWGRYHIRLDKNGKTGNELIEGNFACPPISCTVLEKLRSD